MSGVGDAARSWVERFRPRTGEGSTRMQRVSAFLARLARLGTRQMVRDRAPQMAAALSYRTIFSIIPMLVLSLVVLRAFYGQEGIRDGLQAVFEYTGIAQIEVEAAAKGGIAPADVGGAVEGEGAGGASEGEAGASAAGDEEARSRELAEESLSEWIQRFVDNAADQISGLNYGVITLIGVGVLMYAALSLLFQIEQAFNLIYRSESGRRVLVRLTTYWTLLTLGAVGLFATLGIMAGYRAMVEGLPNWAQVLWRPVSWLPQLGVTWLVLMFAYKRVPNTHVNLRCAAIGAVVAAVLWEIAKGGLRWFMVEMTHTQVVVYGSLALLPIFMFWVYVTWMIVLFGLEVSRAWQTASYEEEMEDPWDGSRSRVVDPASGVALLVRVARAFGEGRSAGATELGRASGLEERTLREVMGALERSGFVHRVSPEGFDEEDQEEQRWSLARGPESVDAADVMRAVLDSGEREVDSAEGAGVVRERMVGSLRGMTLAELAEEGSAG